LISKIAINPRENENENQNLRRKHTDNSYNSGRCLKL